MVYNRIINICHHFAFPSGEVVRAPKGAIRKLTLWVHGTNLSTFGIRQAHIGPYQGDHVWRVPRDARAQGFLSK